ncbi:helix-turn-helix domain-containing protein [Pseudomonas sp. BLCC-B13]|nr:helix-turn-helix domain-containing protein [Pseudomonas sp. BLCC-B13]MDC7827333.1 helix-turn-helix domain-containing protein [Pseudomonas sp. BLCC-B13]
MKPTTMGRLGNSSCLDDISGNAQRARLLAYLRERGAINTFEAIRLLNILRPGARIAELRAQGYNIRTHLATLEDEQGRAHPNVATYYLSTEPVGKVAA